MATIVDVARSAGVSTATVSHVVNGTRAVAEQTELKVRQAIAETGYRQDTLARSMRRTRTESIGLVVSDAGQPAFADMVRGVEAEAARSGYTLLLANSGEDPGQETRVLRVLSSRRVDGMIIAPAAGSTGEEIQAIRDGGTPVVLMDRVGESAGADQVGVENTGLMRDLVSHMVEHGYRRIALASGNPDVSTIAERLTGYREALDAAGIGYRPELLVTGSGLASETRGRAVDLLRGTRRPDAVVCSSTETATGVLEAARLVGLTIPGDLKLAVFDEFPHADLFEPQITAVRQPAVEIGETAMRLLRHRIDTGGTGEPEVVRLAPEIVYRTSCGCASSAPGPP